MGWDIYSFLMPLYGARIGLAAGTIGIIMSTFALATFVVRAILTQLVRHVRQWVLISSAHGARRRGLFAVPVRGERAAPHGAVVHARPRASALRSR